jgi:hypothetical protein
MQEPSEEQQTIINYVKEGYNILVRAVAGSGKSTTVLSLAKQLPEKNILQLAYNSSLRIDIKEKVSVLQLQNIKVHTFHSLAVKYYLSSANTDSGIRYILYNKLEPRQEIPKIDILVIDENQDLTELYFHFVVKFLHDMGSPIQLIVLGDELQCLYEFKGADSRYLTMADKIWCNFNGLSTREFKHCSLRMSYRITNQMAKFVNHAMMGYELMLACRDGPPVSYIKNSRPNIEKIVVNTIHQLLENGVEPNEIFILAASVKTPSSHVRKMENILVENGIPCYVPMFENDKLDERVIDRKIVFSTFHCVKGRQRKYVFVVGFDNNYFMHFARNIQKDQCPNTIYVAATRGIEALYLLEFEQYRTDRPCDFLKMSHYDMVHSDFIQFKGIPRSSLYYENLQSMEEQEKANALIDKKYESPTKMIKFIPDSVMDEITPLIGRIFISINTLESGEPTSSPKSDDFDDFFDDKFSNRTIEIPTIIQTKSGFYEDVSDINGIAIPALYYDYIHKMNRQIDSENSTPNIPKNPSNSIQKMIDNVLLEMKENEHLYLRKMVKKIPDVCETTNDYLFLANVYVAIQERLYSKLKQIGGRSAYNWISESVIDKCKARLNMVITEPYVCCEKTIIHHSMEEAHIRIDACLENYFKDTRFRFSAIIDLETSNTVWELKCTSEISIDHKLQIVIYEWLWNLIYPENKKKFKLLNIKTGELLELNATEEELTKIVVALLKGKYDRLYVRSDEEFLQSSIGYISSVVGENVEN